MTTASGKATRKDDERPETGIRFPDDGRVDQSHRGVTDINNIIANYVSSGALTHLNRATPLYGDFTEAVDLHTAMNRVHEVEAVYGALSAKVRTLSDNDPERFLEMCSDPDELAKLEEAGITFHEDPQDPELPSPPKPPEEIRAESPPPKGDS